MPERAGSAPPSASHFADPLVLSLGRAVGFKAGVFVQGSSVLAAIIQEAGYDPENLSQYGDPNKGWRLGGWKPVRGFRRRVQRAFWNARAGRVPLAARGPETGSWGLTEAGAARARELVGPPPCATHFVEPLLAALGKAAGFKAGVFVQNTSVLEAIIQEAGYDPENLSQYGDPNKGWRLGGRGPTAGFRRRIQRAFRNTKQCSTPLTMKGPGRGSWGLTKAGVVRARALTGGCNLTGDFLDSRLRATGGMDGALMSLLRAALTKRLPRSASADLVDGHIHNCFVRLISRDSLRERLLRGQAVPDTLLATYAVRSGFTDIRRMATNPVCRELYGARTERERETGRLPQEKLPPQGAVNWRREGEYLVVNDFADTTAPEPVELLQDRTEFEALWSSVERAVRTRKPKAWTRYLGVLRMRFEGFTVKEIAAAEGVSQHRASSIVSEARRCLREARQTGALLS